MTCQQCFSVFQLLSKGHSYTFKNNKASTIDGQEKQEGTMSHYLCIFLFVLSSTIYRDCLQLLQTERKQEQKKKKIGTGGIISQQSYLQVLLKNVAPSYNFWCSINCIPSESNGVVKTSFGGSSKRGLFDVKSFYNVLLPHDSTHFHWKNIWRNKTPP